MSTAESIEPVPDEAESNALPLSYPQKQEYIFAQIIYSSNFIVAKKRLNMTFLNGDT